VDLMTRLRQLTEKLTARQQAILEFIRVHQPVSNAQVAKHFGISGSTAGVHLMALSYAGVAWATSSGRWARWKTDKPFAEPKTPPRVAPVSIEQVASIWHYAERCARAA
jgi:DNA-binding CsgD family transcriptional regulator